MRDGIRIPLAILPQPCRFQVLDFQPAAISMFHAADCPHHERTEEDSLWPTPLERWLMPRTAHSSRATAHSFNTKAASGAGVDLAQGVEVMETDNRITFTVSLQSVPGVDFGIRVKPRKGMGQGLLVEKVLHNGAVAAWNRLIATESIGPRLRMVVRAGDTITHINGESDSGDMLWELRARAAGKFTVERLTVDRPPLPGLLRAQASRFEVGVSTHCFTAFQ